MVSGSAALPESVHQSWQKMTGQQLLERYGMTEIGMAISHPYDGERRAGTVGVPLPGVRVRLMNEEGSEISGENEPGELQIQGNNLFLEYWNRPEATALSFKEGWFCTGDIACLDNGYFRILGRNNIDIIKSGGYKLSALEIETSLLDHPEISECAVVGLPDEVWGECVAAAVVLTNQEENTELEYLREWCRKKISPYKIPKLFLRVDQLPRNAMGKVTKQEIKKLFKELQEVQ